MLSGYTYHHSSERSAHLQKLHYRYGIYKNAFVSWCRSVVSLFYILIPACGSGNIIFLLVLFLLRDRAGRSRVRGLVPAVTVP